ncbi:hydroxypyruvate isomerase family protein [Sphingobacterium yanglingense]|uniref:Hydroxypyruvate isomerase n=1 Tax=Sphingobacterium yanglingense TaxID=1437280 RepID=A0A4R6WJN5_9SPHI|nr:TIM barrel protein [Sphingobacterium yanglingense]TDQ78184.1 hydroxypyruvate isomerase [Sphingobacterium yanglingense]
MKRSDFIKNSGLLFGSSLLAPAVSQATVKEKDTKLGDPFRLDYGPHQGMFSASAGKNFLDEIKYMHDLGFRSIEDNGMPGRTVDEQRKVGELLAKLGMRMGVFVVPKGGNGANTLAAGKQEHIDIFLKGCRDSIEVAKRVNAKWITVVPGDYERRLPIGVQTANVIEGLKRGAELLEPHGITMVLEPLSDTPDLFLRFTDQAYEICKAVNSPSCKILYDAYHQQKNEGNLINFMDQCWSEIAYVQVGDNPGRKEPTTGEINYKNVFKWLHNKGYKGIVGMEHGMSKGGKEGEDALVKAYREVDNF